jgi:nucleoside-diphosphate-sugar epimerase
MMSLKDIAESRRTTMHVFVTGASGWIGSAAVDGLLASGHEVTGLARSDAAAAALEAKNVTVLRGDLDDLESLRVGADTAEAVIHLANKHDWSNPAASNAAERAAVETLGDALAGSKRPLLVAAGVAGLATGRPSHEDDPSPFHGPNSPRGGSENLAFEFLDRRVHTVSLRFSPTVHGTGRPRLHRDDSVGSERGRCRPLRVDRGVLRHGPGRDQHRHP